MKIKLFFKKAGLWLLNIIKSFFYRDNDFQPVYFWVTLIMGLIVRMIYLKIEVGREISDTLLISCIGTVVTILGIYNWNDIRNPKHLAKKGREILEKAKRGLAE